MSEPSLSASFWRGCLDGLPFLLVVIPFSMLFGVLGTEAGLSILEVMGFSVLIIAGAAQFTALQLMTEHTSVVLVLLASLVVNLRMAMYSAALAPHLGAAPMWQRAVLAYFNVDQIFALAIIEYERNPSHSVRQKIAFYLGASLPICPVWYLFTLIGALFGTTIPDSWGLDFALPIAFIAMFAPMLRTPAHILTAFVAIVLSLAFAWLPSGLGMLVAAFGAMLAGARAELWLEARR